MTGADEFTALFADWLTATVTLESSLGHGFDGEAFADPTPVPGVMVEEARRLIRNTEGNEVVSEVTLYVDAEAPAFKLGDRVTIGDRVTKVLRVANPAVYGLFDFRVVNCE